MVEITLRKRKSPVLTPSSLPCLRHVVTLNVTEGCALGCKYCYIQGYSHYPGAERVVLYENLPELVAEDLKRKRRRLRRVYFSPSSDAFQYPSRGCKTCHCGRCACCWKRASKSRFSPRASFGGRFWSCSPIMPTLSLPRSESRRWIVALCRAIEPRAAPPEMRIATIDALTRMGVHTTARLDPLIPDVTDTDDSVLPLLRALAKAGVRSAAASYLFVRSPFVRQVASTLATAGAQEHPSPTSWATQTFAEGGGGGRMIGLGERSRRFARLQALGGNSVGVRIRPCRCKNPELTDEPCAIAGPANSAIPDVQHQGEFTFMSPNTPASMST